MKKVRVNLFITSFLPLWLSIVIFNCFKVGEAFINDWKCEQKFFSNLFTNLYNNLLAIFVILVALIIPISSMMQINKFLKERQNVLNKPKAEVSNIQPQRKVSSEFLITYILPLLVFNFTEMLDVILFAVYFSFLMYISIRNNNIYTNIFLELKKYKMYTGDFTCPVPIGNHKYENSLLISNQSFSSGIAYEIEYEGFENYIYFDLNIGANNE